MKKIFLIASLLIFGCSQEQDTRLICDCVYKQITYDKVDIDFQFKGPEKIDCSDPDNSKSLVFNVSDKKFNLENTYLGNEDEIVFREDTIFTKQTNQWHYREFELNRINLKFKEQSGIIDLKKKNHPDRNLFDEIMPIFETFSSKIYQCKVVDGV